MITAAVGLYFVAGLVIARLIISAQPEESTSGTNFLPALMATAVLALFWPVAIVAALVLAVVVSRRKRRRD